MCCTAFQSTFFSYELRYSMRLDITKLHDCFVKQENPHCICFFFSEEIVVKGGSQRIWESGWGVWWVWCRQELMGTTWEKVTRASWRRGTSGPSPVWHCFSPGFSLIQDVVTHRATYTCLQALIFALWFENSDFSSKRNKLSFSQGKTSDTFLPKFSLQVHWWNHLNWEGKNYIACAFTKTVSA